MWVFLIFMVIGVTCFACMMVPYTYKFKLDRHEANLRHDKEMDEVRYNRSRQEKREERITGLGGS